MITYLRNNKHWIFSGIGVFIIALLINTAREQLFVEKPGENPPNTNSSNANRREIRATSNRAADTAIRQKPTADAVQKVGGIGFTPSVLADFSYSSSTLRVRLIDMAVYTHGRIYLKVSVCNIGSDSVSLWGLRAWYTPPDGRDSINWSVIDHNKTKFLFLKPGECGITGAWSEQLTSPFRFTRPLGVCHISSDHDRLSSSIDLNHADSQSQVYF
jgi:hypothetical protein